ncbi:MAG: IS256 family transposase [Proteobacteria bacterium]|nr:IS256 family transposase [Pseudomonadota bacterium]
MREMDFSESNLGNRWLGVKSIWKEIEGEAKRFVKIRLERALVVEQGRRVGCSRYKRSRRRRGYRNGSRERDLLTSYGWIEDLRVPRLREGGIESEVLERYRRRQRALDRILLEAFLLGHSTRKSVRWFKKLFGAEISPQAVSNIVKELDQEVGQYHRRCLGDHYRFLYLDGLWITVTRPVKVKKVLLVALGVKEDGSKELLSFQLAGSESEASWWGFISDLKQRGLVGEKLEVIVSDGASGLVKAHRALYPRVPHQLCTLHKAMDLAGHLGDKRHRRRIIADALRVFEGETVTQVRKNLKGFCEKWSTREPQAVRNFIRGFEYCLVYLEYPDPIRTMLKTNNPLERYLQELRRRIIPMRSFNNVKSAERIIYGLIAYVLNQPQDVPNHQFTQLA